MRTARLKVAGASIKSLIELVQHQFATSYSRQPYVHRANELVVTAGEEFYLRSGSFVFWVVVLDFSQPDTCQVDILCGGSEAFDWGAEKHRYKRMVQFFRDVCPAHNWQLEESPSPP